MDIKYKDLTITSGWRHLVECAPRYSYFQIFYILDMFHWCHINRKNSIALFDMENFLNSTYLTKISKVQVTLKISKTLSKSSSTYIVRGLIVNQLFRNSHSGPKNFKSILHTAIFWPLDYWYQKNQIINIF